MKYIIGILIVAVLITVINSNAKTKHEKIETKSMSSSDSIQQVGVIIEADISAMR